MNANCFFLFFFLPLRLSIVRIIRNRKHLILITLRPSNVYVEGKIHFKSLPLMAIKAKKEKREQNNDDAKYACNADVASTISLFSLFTTVRMYGPSQIEMCITSSSTSNSPFRYSLNVRIYMRMCVRQPYASSPLHYNIGKAKEDTSLALKKRCFLKRIFLL